VNIKARPNNLKNLPSGNLKLESLPETLGILECLEHLNAIWGFIFLKLKSADKHPTPAWRENLKSAGWQLFANTMLPKEKLNKK